MVVLRDNRFLFRLERAPAATAAGTRAAAPAISIYRTGVVNTTKTKDLVKTGGGRVLLVKLTIAIAIVCVHLLTILISRLLPSLFSLLPLSLLSWRLRCLPCSF